MRSSIKSHQKAFSLTEVLVALLLLSTCITGIAKIFLNVLYLNKNTDAYLQQTAILKKSSENQ